MLIHIIIIMIEEIQEANYVSIKSSTRRSRSKFKQTKREASSSLDMSTTIQLNETEKQCRICLDNEVNQENQLIAPCKCTGTVKFVHDKCFRQWIQKQYGQKNKKEQASFLKKGVECELCKVRLSLIFTFKYVCCQGKFSRQCKQHPLIFMLFLLFFIINLGCCGFLSYYASQRSFDFKKQYITSMVTILAFVFLALTAIITLYYFIFDYLVEKVMFLEGYEQKKIQNKRYSQNQIVPQSFEEE